MNEKDFKREWTSAVPDMPEHFHSRVEMTLDSIVRKEANMKESTKHAVKSVGRFSTRTIALALALLMILGAVALAATHWHIFDSIPYLTGEGTPKNADSLMQGSLYQGIVNNVEITVREAGYDGRTLLLQYSFRMLDVDHLIGQEGLTEEEEQLLLDHRVGWWIDSLWINGKAVNMPSASSSGPMGGELPGEIIWTDIWRLDNEGVALDGPIEISLPIGDRQPLSEYSRKDHPEKYDADGTLKLPDQGMVTFTYDARDILARVVTIRPNQEKKLAEGRAQVSEAAFTPLMTYITLELKTDPEALAAYIREHGEGHKDEQGSLLFPFDGADVWAEWIMSLELVDGSGALLFPDQNGNNGFGSEEAEFLYPYLESIPAELYLAPVKDGAADMSRAVLVKPANQ